MIFERKINAAPVFQVAGRPHEPSPAFMVFEKQMQQNLFVAAATVELSPAFQSRRSG